MLYSMTGLERWAERAFVAQPSRQPACLALCTDANEANGVVHPQLWGDWRVSFVADSLELVLELDNGQALVFWLGVPDEQPAPVAQPIPRLVLEGTA